MYFKNWIKRACVWKGLPCFVYWEIWKHMVVVLIEKQKLYIWKVVLKELSSFGEFCKEKAKMVTRNPSPPIINLNMHVWCPDGASKEAGKNCGTGVVLRMNRSNSFNLKKGSRNGINISG